jgi:DNA transformation protein and related proteins
MSTPVEQAINIGSRLAAERRQVGVADLDSLRKLGAQEAWGRLRAAGLRDCTNSRLALEGAVRGVRWMSIPEAERARIVEGLYGSATGSASGAAGGGPSAITSSAG